MEVSDRGHRGRIVVVGCGSIGRRHARVLSCRDDVAVELCEPQRGHLDVALAEVGDVRTHDDFRTMMGSRPDMVVIATPQGLHADQTAAALDAGVHVLCEKPMADTVANSRRMQAAAENGPVLNIGFMLHFHPAFIRIKDLIGTGRLGRVLHVHWHIGTYRTLLNSISRHQANVPGAILLDYAHQPDLLRWWLGKMPAAVYASGFRAGDFRLDSDPNVLALTLEYDEPLLATINLNYVQHPERAECEVIGDQGWARCDLHSGQLELGSRADESRSKERFGVEKDDMIAAEHQAFFDAIDGKRGPESPPEDAIASMYVIEAAIASWREGRRVEIDQQR